MFFSKSFAPGVALLLLLFVTAATGQIKLRPRYRRCDRFVNEDKCNNVSACEYVIDNRPERPSLCRGRKCDRFNGEPKKCRSFGCRFIKKTGVCIQRKCRLYTREDACIYFRCEWDARNQECVGQLKEDPIVL